MKGTTRTWNVFGKGIVVVWLAFASGCANLRADEESAPTSVFVYTRTDLEAEIRSCESALTQDCRNDLIYVVKAHIDAEQLKGSAKVDWMGKAFALAVLGGSTATTRVSGETAKTNVSTGLAVLAGIRQIFDVGEGPSGISASDVWERIVARMNMPLSQYPLEAALADLEEYRVAGVRG